MKIIIAMTQAPFITGGADYHAQNLKTALQRAGHEVELVSIPMMDNPPELMVNQIVAVRLLEIERTWAGNSDLCIGLKFPAYFMKHSNKVIWVLHQYRQAYDLWGSGIYDLRDQIDGARIRDVILNADNQYLREAKRLYVNSQNVAARMKKFNQITSEPLYHPCPDMDKFYCKEYDNYILMPSRINITKRQKLAVEAMALTRSSIKLYIVGKADNVDEFGYIQNFVTENKLEQKVRFFDYVSQEKKFDLYANARAVMFVPYDEDYGYITLEGMSASKAIITCTDSGGPLEFIENNKSGFVAAPNAVDLAKAIDELANSEALAREMGTAAKRHISDMDISWDYVVKELTK